LAEVRADVAYAGLEAGQETEDVVSVVGRVMFLRGTGKLAFAELREGEERLQVMLSLGEVGEPALEAWKRDVDLGDQVSGHRPRGQQPPRRALRHGDVVADGVQGAAPLPTLHKDLAEDTRVRRRYVDLVVRPEARDMVRTKATVLGPCARRSTGSATWRWRPPCCSCSTAGPRHGRSTPTSTRSTCR
jgi:lysyl-tRNA synthetase class 2